MSAENHGLLSVTAELSYLSRTSNTVYIVRVSPEEGYTCECEGGFYRGSCWHIEDARKRLAIVAEPPPTVDANDIAAALGLGG